MKQTLFGDHLPASKLRAVAAAALFLAFGTAAGAQPTIIYNSIIRPLQGNPSQSAGAEALGYNEIGDGVIFSAGTGRSVTAVKVLLSSFACQSGVYTAPAGGPNACVTTPGSTFSQAITLRIYAVGPGVNPLPGPLLATVTQTFLVPFRPSNQVGCAAYNATPGTGYFNAIDGQCDNGISNLVTFNLSGVPLPDRVIITVSYNTTHYGYAPIGTGAACFSTPTGCPYDFLNVATDAIFPTVGALIDPFGVYVNFIAPNSCTNTPTNGLVDDTPCNFGHHLELEVDASFAPEAFAVHYLSNLNIGDGVINIINTGASASLGGPVSNGNICVNVYAFSPDEQEVSCCSCLLTPNALVSLSARQDILSNTLTPQVPTSLVIKLVATIPGTTVVPGTTSTPPDSDSVCNPTLPFVGNNLAPGLSAFATNLHPVPVGPPPAGTFGITESPFVRASLSAAEISRITTLCQFTTVNGSGFGVCRSCRLGGLGAVKR